MRNRRSRLDEPGYISGIAYVSLMCEIAGSRGVLAGNLGLKFEIPWVHCCVRRDLNTFLSFKLPK